MLPKWNFDQKGWRESTKILICINHVVNSSKAEIFDICLVCYSDLHVLFDVFQLMIHLYLNLNAFVDFFLIFHISIYKLRNLEIFIVMFIVFIFVTICLISIFLHACADALYSYSNWFKYNLIFLQPDHTLTAIQPAYFCSSFTLPPATPFHPVSWRCTLMSHPCCDLLHWA